MARAVLDPNDIFRGHFPKNFPFVPDKNWRNRVAACRQVGKQLLEVERFSEEATNMLGVMGQFCVDENVNVRQEARQVILQFQKTNPDIHNYYVAKAAESAGTDLGHWRARVRRQACQDLGDCGSAAAGHTDTLRFLLNDEDQQVAVAARSSLAKLHEIGLRWGYHNFESAAASAATDLTESGWYGFARRDACQDLGMLGEAALPHYTVLSDQASSPHKCSRDAARLALDKLDMVGRVPAAQLSDRGSNDVSDAYSRKNMITPSTCASPTPPPSL